MCIIAYSAKGQFNRKELQICENANPDGIGIMVHLGDSVRIKKGFKNTSELLKFAQEFKGKPIGIHYRIATHGAVTPENCHPFGIGLKAADVMDGEVMGAMMHNGIIALTSGNPKISDSYLFAKDYLPRFKVLDKTDSLLLNACTAGSRLLIFKKGNIVCSTGSWEKSGEVYYSNTAYKAYDYKAYARNYKYDASSEYYNGYTNWKGYYQNGTADTKSSKQDAIDKAHYIPHTMRYGLISEADNKSLILDTEDGKAEKDKPLYIDPKNDLWTLKVGEWRRSEWTHCFESEDKCVTYADLDKK